jgi:RHS repeat-associated protein
VQYVWSPVYVDALVLRDRDSNGDGTLDERLYVVQDANYNVTALFDNSGSVVERYAYDPFGQVTVLAPDWSERAAGSAFGWVYLHQGGRFDATSGLYHFRHRDYSPTLGRWTSLDPIRYEAADVNLYRVVFNAPTVYTDPSGLQPPDRPPVLYSRPSCMICHGRMDSSGRVDYSSMSEQERMWAARWLNIPTTDPQVLADASARLNEIAQDTRRTASMAVDFLPIAGQVKAGIELGVGFDPIAMEWRTGTERAIAGVGLIPWGKTCRLLRQGDEVIEVGARATAPVRGARAGEGLAGAAADSRLIWCSAAGDVVVDGASLPGRTGMVVPRRLTAAEMSALQQSYGVEFALIYELGPGKGGGGGRYLLFSGGPTNVWFPPNGNYIWISHTHPAGYPLRASTADQNWLRLMQTNGSPQRTSTVVPVDGDPFRFNTTNKRLP